MAAKVPLAFCLRMMINESLELDSDMHRLCVKYCL